MDTGRHESKRWPGRGLLDSLTLPPPPTSLTPSRPSAPSYRPQWSSSPPTSPTFDSPRTPDVRHSSRPTYRLPSFKETFGQLSFDPHLSDDEVPPSSDIGYTHSEYDCSDPGTPDDRLPSVPIDSPAPEDIPFDRPQRAHRLSVSSEHEEEAILGLLDLRTRPRVSSFASDRSAPDLVSTISPETENETSLFPMTPDRSSTDPVDGRRVKIEEEVVIVGEDKPPQLMPLDSRPSETGQGGPPELEAVPEAAPVSDPTDEIHEDPRRPSHPHEEVVQPVASPVSTPPATSSENVREAQEDDMPSLHTNAPDSCDGDFVPTVPDASLPSLVIPGPTLSVPRTPNRSTSRTRSRSRSRSRSLSPFLPSSPLTCLSSSPIREEETRQSTPESDITDVETTCKLIKTSAKRRSIGEADGRASKKSKLETVSTDFPADMREEEQPVSEPVRKNGKKSARSSSPSPCPEPSPVSMDVTASLNANDSGSTDQDLMGMVVEALAITRASSMDVESIRKIVVDTRPSLKTEHTKAQLKQILLELLDSGAQSGFFGSVPSSGKDEGGKPLPPRYFYVPDRDVDQERAALLRNMMPRAAGRRSESMKYKQYYWKPLGKWSRWDAEDDL